MAYLHIFQCHHKSIILYIIGDHYNPTKNSNDGIKNQPTNQTKNSIVP